MFIGYGVMELINIVIILKYFPNTMSQISNKPVEEPEPNSPINSPINNQSPNIINESPLVNHISSDEEDGQKDSLYSVICHGEVLLFLLNLFIYSNC
eukprot:UN34118